jgi:hypothetical protein
MTKSTDYSHCEQESGSLHPSFWCGGGDFNPSLLVTFNTSDLLIASATCSLVGVGLDCLVLLRVEHDAQTTAEACQGEFCALRCQRHKTFQHRGCHSNLGAGDIGGNSRLSGCKVYGAPKHPGGAKSRSTLMPCTPPHNVMNCH